MAILKKYSLSGGEIGEVSIDDALLKLDANSQMVKDYLVAYVANQRQWSANTKTRTEVSHSGQKPHPQKGTGRARQGYLGAPQYKGGGRVFGPRPKFNQHVRMNKKEKQAVIRSLLSQKIKDSSLHVLQYEELDKPKTKIVAQFLKERALSGKRVLFLGGSVQVATNANQEKASSNEKYEIFLLSMQNLPKVDFDYLPKVNGYELAKHQEIFVLDSALDELMVLLGGAK